MPLRASVIRWHGVRGDGYMHLGATAVGSWAMMRSQRNHQMMTTMSMILMSVILVMDSRRMIIEMMEMNVTITSAYDYGYDYGYDDDAE